MKNEGTCQGHAIHVFTRATLTRAFELHKVKNNLQSEEEEEEIN